PYTTLFRSHAQRGREALRIQKPAGKIIARPEAHRLHGRELVTAGDDHDDGRNVRKAYELAQRLEPCVSERGRLAAVRAQQDQVEIAAAAVAGVGRLQLFGG